MFNKILLRRKNLILLEEKINTYDTGINYKYALAIMKNIEPLGYTFDEKLFSTIASFDIDTILTFNELLVGILKEFRGANKEYIPFYQTFPDLSMYEDWELIFNALIHYWTSGQLVPLSVEPERLPLVEDVKLIKLSVGTKEDLVTLRDNLITVNTSLSKTDKEDLISLLKLLGTDNLPKEIPYKENIALVTGMIMQYTNPSDWKLVLSPYFKTATDVLRFITFLSDGDISLAENTAYRQFKRNERDLLLFLLDSCKNIEEDMLRYGDKWIRIGEILHPGEYSKYDKALKAFNKIRNNVKIETFKSKLNKANQNYDLDAALNLLISRPGEFARQLDYLFRTYTNYMNHRKIISCFEKVASEVSIPVLLQVKEHFKYRNNLTETRIFFPKGQLAKAWVKTNTLGEIHSDTVAIINAICENAIQSQLKKKESWRNVYISDSYNGYAFPQSQRSASEGMKFLTRYSRIPVNKDCIRLFIHWSNEYVNTRERKTDIDLSCSFLDEHFNGVTHISYTNLRESFAKHSGDFVNAPRPHGAVEFIDLDINKALEKGIRYAVVQVYGYTYSPFNKLNDLYFGWMERDNLDFGEVFEPSTVEQKINLTANTMCSLPVVFDLVNKELIWIDLAFNSYIYFGNNVENNVQGVGLTIKGMIEAHKPQLYDVVYINAITRGQIVSNRNEADIIFDTSTEKPVELIYRVIKDNDGEVIDYEQFERVKEEVKIITPYDIDFFMSQCI